MEPSTPKPKFYTAIAPYNQTRFTIFLNYLLFALIGLYILLLLVTNILWYRAPISTQHRYSLNDSLDGKTSEEEGGRVNTGQLENMKEKGKGGRGVWGLGKEEEALELMWMKSNGTGREGGEMVSAKKSWGSPV